MEKILITEELAFHPDKPLVYSSDSIHERRKRVLKTVRRMLTEKGLDGFNIRELCHQADLAPRTFYNAFQSKDRVIALAMRDAYEDVNRYMRYRTSADTLAGIINRIIVVNTRNLKSRHYTQAVTAIYFSPTIDEDVWNSLRGMAFINLHQWLACVERDGELEGWISVDTVADLLCNIEFSTIHDWVHGRLTDDEYLIRIVTAVLAFTVGVTKGATKAEAIELLDTIKRTGSLPYFPKPVYQPPE